MKSIRPLLASIKPRQTTKKITNDILNASKKTALGLSGLSLFSIGVAITTQSMPLTDFEKQLNSIACQN
ncbi:hypothetical protein DID75_02045 [Candidatus Marinamargulisbacteria bacterium SCGC AG-410-N11]|nr:hypothetical protein DID75_02045 [Candidatus Marinamargulisbacteria bacterium SCGC AG-410-N11]